MPIQFPSLLLIAGALLLNGVLAPLAFAQGEVCPIAAAGEVSTAVGSPVHIDPFMVVDSGSAIQCLFEGDAVGEGVLVGRYPGFFGAQDLAPFSPGQDRLRTLLPDGLPRDSLIQLTPVDGVGDTAAWVLPVDPSTAPDSLGRLLVRRGPDAFVIGTENGPGAVTTATAVAQAVLGLNQRRPVTHAYFSSSFSNIDATANPREFVDYMDDANAMDFFRAAKLRTYALLALRTGDHVLDVGCGAGDDVRAMAEIVGPSGRAVGVDSSQTMIDAARERSATSPPGVEFFVGNAEDLDLPDAALDACRADRVLQHLSNPAKAVSEMARVVRAGGRVVAFEPDNGGLLIDAPDKEVTRKITQFRGDIVRTGWIGRQLPRLFKTAGLSQVEVTVLPSPRTDYRHTNFSLHLDDYAARAADAGVISSTEAAEWSAALAAAAADGTFFCVVTMFLVVGRKP